jgi:hypothetical protein
VIDALNDLTAKTLLRVGVKRGVSREPGSAFGNVMLDPLQAPPPVRAARFFEADVVRNGRSRGAELGPDRVGNLTQSYVRPRFFLDRFSEATVARSRA